MNARNKIYITLLLSVTLHHATLATDNKKTLIPILGPVYGSAGKLVINRGDNAEEMTEIDVKYYTDIGCHTYQGFSYQTEEAYSVPVGESHYVINSATVYSKHGPFQIDAVRCIQLTVTSIPDNPGGDHPGKWDVDCSTAPDCVNSSLQTRTFTYS
ncbi:MAG: hypothetical protein P1U34_09915 [Coxiellaceae bacterium]|nr:hypothetical protein [Coxiellaceae bacterium]